MTITVTVTIETDDAHGPITGDVLRELEDAAENDVGAVAMMHLGDSWSIEAKARVDL